MYLWEVGYEMDIANALIKSDSKVSVKTKDELYKKAVSLGYCRDHISFVEAYQEIIALNR